MNIELPNQPLVDKYINEFINRHSTEEKALRTIFSVFPDNNSKEAILIKVVLLNSIYHTRIKEKDRDCVVDHIFTMGSELDCNFHSTKKRTL